MMQVQAKWWRLPDWSSYLIAIIGAGLALMAGHPFEQAVGDRAVFLTATLPVVIAAFVGGLGPGLLATLLGLAGIVYFFLPPLGEFGIGANRDRIMVAGFGLLWTIMSTLCGVMHHGTRRMASEKRKVDEQRSNLDAILASITDGFFSVDGEWRLTHMNPAFERFIGRTKSELLGANLWDIFLGRDYQELRVKLTESLRRMQPYSGDLWHSKSGRWHHLRAFPKLDGLFVYLQDITEQKTMEQSRERMLVGERKARSDAEALNRMKDEFVATLSHELRTPLTTILGWTEILRKSEGREGKLAEGLSVIEKSARHQTQLIGDLLDVSRMAAGKLRLEKSLLNLADTVYEAVEIARPSAEGKQLDLRVEVEGDENFVDGDPARLFQVVSNLLSNAIKFTPNGGDIQVRVFRDQAFAVCQIRDSGEGIDPDFLPFIFDRFRQSDASSTRRHGGLGLGLSIVKQLVDLHHGQVRAVSEGRGKGCLFEVRLPAAAIPSNHFGSERPPERPSNDIADLSILVIDDDEATRNLLKQLLQDARAKVWVASRGIEGLEMLARNTFDVILSDISMPEMDGYQFLEIARQRFRTRGSLPPAIALTALAHEADDRKAESAGFASLLTKPVDVARLIELIAATQRGRPVSPPPAAETASS